MNKVRTAIKLGILYFCILFLLSWTWYLSIVARVGIIHPLKVIDYLYSDLKYMGPYAVIIDVVFVVIVWFSYKFWKSEQLDKDTHND